MRSLLLFFGILTLSSAPVLGVDLVDRFGNPWGTFEISGSTLELYRAKNGTTSRWQRDTGFDTVDTDGQRLRAFVWYERGLIMNIRSDLTGQIRQGRTADNNLNPVRTNVHINTSLGDSFDESDRVDAPLGRSPFSGARRPPGIQDRLLLEQRVEKGERLPDATLTFTNTHDKTLIVRLRDSEGRQDFRTLSIEPMQRATVTVHRFSNPKIRQTVQQRDLTGRPIEVERVLEITRGPHVEVRVSEYKVVSMYIDRTGKDPVSQTERKDERGLGVFYLPSDSRLRSQEIDAMSSAVSANNPGAFAYQDQVDPRNGIAPTWQPQGNLGSGVPQSVQDQMNFQQDTRQSLR